MEGLQEATCKYGYLKNIDKRGFVKKQKGEISTAQIRVLTGETFGMLWDKYVFL